MDKAQTDTHTQSTYNDGYMSAHSKVKNLSCGQKRKYLDLLMSLFLSEYPAAINLVMASQIQGQTADSLLLYAPCMVST